VVEQLLADLVGGGPVELLQGPLDEQHRQAVHRRPREQLGVRTPLGRQQPHLEQPVEGGGQQLVRRTPGRSGGGAVVELVGEGEGGAEQARLVLRVGQVAGADGAQAGQRARSAGASPGTRAWRVSIATASCDIAVAATARRSAEWSAKWR
jgi:hypothetical protein